MYATARQILNACRLSQTSGTVVIRSISASRSRPRGARAGWAVPTCGLCRPGYICMEDGSWHSALCNGEISLALAHS